MPSLSSAGGRKPSLNEEFGFLDRNRGKESFLEYFRSKMADDDNFRNWNTAYQALREVLRRKLHL